MKRRAEIVCPFCLVDTGRWKLVDAVKIRNSRNEWEWHAQDESSIRAFEQKILQDHLDKGQCVKYVLSPSLLEMYNLTQPKDL